MGANFNTMSVNASHSTKEVEKLFQQAQEDDRYDNGHSYSGGFGMATGLVFHPQIFESEQAAKEWLVDNCKKWENAIAVLCPSEKEGQIYLIGAWCSS